jgi:hypothetical protein
VRRPQPPAKPLWQRLLVKPGKRVLALNPPGGYRELLGALPAGATLDLNVEGLFDVVHLFAAQQADLTKYAADAIAATKTGGALWVSYPKKAGAIRSDITRDSGWEVVRSAGWEGVSLISVDETWSAMRVRPIAAGR